MFSWTFLDRLVAFYFILFFFPLKTFIPKFSKNPKTILEHTMKKKSYKTVYLHRAKNCVCNVNNLKLLLLYPKDRELLTFLNYARFSHSVYAFQILHAQLTF